MTDNNQISPVKAVLKRDKRDKFNLFDSSLATLMFIVFLLVLKFLMEVLPESFLNNFFVAFFLSFLVEAVFAFAVMFTGGVRNVQILKATKINKKIDFLSGLLAVAMSFIALFAFSQLSNVFSNFLGKLGYSQVISEIAIPNFLVYIIYVFLMCICPALFEEFLFRGAILSGLKELGKHKAVFLSALIFSLMHGGPDQTIHQFLLGIVLGYAFVYSGSLWVPIIIHFVNNFFAVTMIYISNLLPQDLAGGATELPSWGGLIVSFVIAIIMAAIGFAIIYACLKALKSLREKREGVTKTDKYALLDKENLTSDEIEKLKNNLNNQQTSKPKLNIKKSELRLTIVLFVFSGLYMIVEWVLTLLTGLGIL